MKSKFFSKSNSDYTSQKGASMVELLVVVVIATIIGGFSIFYYAGSSRLFKPDDESLKLIDLLQEARQRSLTQRETMRVEIDLTDNMARIIDENTPTTETDDKKIREVKLFTSSEVKLDSQPSNITTFPAETMSVPMADFRISVYPPSVAHRVCTLRFMRDGTVYNAGNNPTALGASVTGATLFIWSPKPNAASESEIARAITIIGTTGSIRIWEYNPASTATDKWKDSRRTGVFGQSGNSNANS